MLINIRDIFHKYALKITGILHIGASECEELQDYLAVGVPKENIIWIEGNDYLCNKITTRDPKIVIYNATITDTDNQVRDFIVTNNFQSSSILELQEHLKEHPHVFETSRKKVVTITIDTLLKDNTIPFNFVNIDIQGAELLALKGMKHTLKDIDYIYLEVNEKHLYKDCALIGEIDEYLKSFNFNRVETKMTQHGWGDAFYVKLK